MNPEKHVTEGDSGAKPAAEIKASDGLAAPSDKVETKEPVSTPVEAESQNPVVFETQADLVVTGVVITPVEPPRRSEPKADSKAKPKPLEEPKPAPEVKAPEPKSLAQIMKVDLRGRKRRT
jgi:hypothetical protein